MPLSGDFIKPMGSIDVYRIKIIGIPYLYAGSLFIAIMGFLLWKGKRKVAFILFVTGIVFLQAWGMDSYYDKLTYYQIHTIHGRQLAELILNDDIDGRTLIKFSNKIKKNNYFSNSNLSMNLKFWGVTKFSIDELEIETDNCTLPISKTYMIVRMKDGIREGAEIVSEYCVRGVDFAIIGDGAINVDAVH